MKFEIFHQAEEHVYDDANGNTVTSERGYWFRIVDGPNDDVLAISEMRSARKAGVLKAIDQIIDGVGGISSDTLRQGLIVDRTGR